MQKFLLYNSVEPEELPTLRELNTIGKAPGVPCRSTVSARITWRRAVEAGAIGGTLLEGTDCYRRACFVVPWSSEVPLVAVMSHP